MRELVESHLGSVPSIAREYLSFGIPFDDLLSEGNVGLIEAAARYDPDRGAAFMTYAAWWVRKRILNLIARQRTIVRLPKLKLRRLRILRLTEAALSQRLGRPPMIDEISRESGMSVEEIQSLLGASPRELPLERGIEDGEDFSPIIALVPDPNVSSPSAGVFERDVEEWIAEVMEDLTERERKVLALRFGFDDEPEHTLQSIGDRLGLTRERVRQIESRALKKIRQALHHRGNGGKEPGPGSSSAPVLSP